MRRSKALLRRADLPKNATSERQQNQQENTSKTSPAKVEQEQGGEKMSHYRGQPERSKRSHGFPVQIYTEVVDVGKSMSSTKKRIKWRFGWTESPEEQEVELIHSLVSGKKTLFEDGNEIHSQTSLLETKFNHAWHSHGLYVFRVEAHISMMEESQYFLSIDGIRFMDWEKKGVPRRMNEPNRGRYSSEEQDEYRDERGRGGQQQSRQIQSQSQQQQQQRRGAPGAAGPSRQPQQQQQQQPQRQQQQRQPQQQQQRQQPQQSYDDDSTFDPFAPSAAQTNAFDPFAQPPAPSPPGQTTAAAAKSRSRTASSSAEPQLFDQFDGPPTKAVASSSFDAFSSPASGDPFASQSPQTGSSPGGFAAFQQPAAAPARPKAVSADLLSMDFVGMSFNPAPPVPQQAPPAAADAFAPPPPVPPAATIPSDPWTDAKLVNLDLSGKAADAAPTTRPTAQAPSLNHLMGNTLAPSPFAGAQFAPQPQSAAPQAVQAADPFGAPALLPPSMAPRPVVPAVAPVMSKSAAISSMGGGAPPPNPFASMRPQLQTGTMAPGMASPPAMPQFMGAMGARPNPYASGAAPNPYAVGVAPNPYAAPTQGMPNRGLSIPVANPYGAPAGPPKSSLDSIDWKS